MIVRTNPVTRPMPTFGIFGTTVPRVTPVGRPVYIDSIQILGFMPLTCVTQHSRLKAFSQCDCRDWKDDDCYMNPVFGDSTGDFNLLKNDKSSFLLEYPWFYQNQFDDPTRYFFELEEWNGTEWLLTTLLDNNDFGVLKKLGTMCIKHWTEYTIDWQKVIMRFGEGLYRFRVNNSIFGFGSTYVSEPFCLKEWSCKAANKTVRWEASITGGRVGSIVDDQRVFELCCMQSQDAFGNVTWNDSIRMYGFFGREKTEYERENIEYQNGEVVKVRDEAIQKFEFESALLPKYLHDRLKAYGNMADQLLVSDYNWNNSDYEIDQRRVVCEGSYEPQYDVNTRYSLVKAVYAEGFKNVIRDKCCVPKGPIAQS